MATATFASIFYIFYNQFLALQSTEIVTTTKVDEFLLLWKILIVKARRGMKISQKLCVLFYSQSLIDRIVSFSTAVNRLTVNLTFIKIDHLFVTSLYHFLPSQLLLSYRENVISV